MSDILPDGEEWKLWLSGQPPDSLTLQLPLPSDMFAIVLSGCKFDDGGIIAWSGWINVLDLAA